MKIIRFYSNLCCVFKILFTVLSLVVATICMAQDVEEVVVQAEKSDNAQIDDLVSAAVIDGEKLKDAGIENVEDVAAYVPNLVLTETSTGTSIVVRGIGAGVNQGFDQSVGLYIDGVPLPRSQMARAPFLDLAGVQVLRGPQYVKDGNFSIAGSVHMLTNTAKDEFEAGVDITVIPSQSDNKVLATFAAPIGETMGLRLALQTQTGDGYVENVALAEDGPQTDDLLARLVYTWAPTDNINLKLKFEDGSFDRRGRQIEIIESQVTPDFRTFPEAGGLDGIVRDPRSRSLVRGIGLANEFRNETDFQLIPIGAFYDEAYVTTNIPAFAGRSFLQVLSDLYTNDNSVSGVDELNGIPFSLPDRVTEAPIGLLDDRLDFRRAANEDEFSNNDSQNLTLNFDVTFGDHTLEFVGSRIEYDFEEAIDTDFTPVPILFTQQSESYEQDFFRLEYQSPEDARIQFAVGGSLLESTLTFEEQILGRFGGPTNQEEAVEFLETFPQDVDQEFVTFGGVDGTAAPFLPYFGRISPVLVAGLQLYAPNREFEQDATISAGFAEVKVNLSDTLRATLGARYTRSKKRARRDFAFLLQDGTPFAVPETVRDAAGNLVTPVDFTATERNIRQALATIYNLGEHTDRVPPSPGRPGGLLPFCDEVGVSFALGGPCDPDPASQPRIEEAFLPSLSIDWDVNEYLSVFGSVRQANKLGGFDARSVSTPSTPPGLGLQSGTFQFEDEDATTFELGTRWFLPSGLGELQATLFFTDFKNLQVSTADRSVGRNVRNAGAAETLGIEIEGLLQFTDSFNMSYSFAWIDFEFTDFELGSCALFERPDSVLVTEESANINNVLPLGTILPIIYEGTVTPNDSTTNGFGLIPIDPVGTFTVFQNPDGSTRPPQAGDDPASLVEVFNLQRFDFENTSLPTFCDFAGRTNQFVADVQSTLIFNYEKELSGIGVFKPTLDVIYNSGYETTVTQDADVAQDEYFQFNGRLALQSFNESWEIALVGQNLSNERIVSFASEVPIATRIQASKTHFGFVRPPRTIGLNFRYDFY